MSLPRIFINRVNIETKKLSQDLPPEITCWPEEEDKLGNFRAVMKGPLDSPYAGGIFTLRIVLPVRYPHEPPKVNFLTRIYHPNVDDSGRICLDILKSLPKGTWTSGQNIMSTLMSIYSLLSNPNADDPLDIEAATLFKNDRLLFNETVKKFTSSYATGEDTEKVISDEPTPQPLETKEIENREPRSKASFSLKKNKNTTSKVEPKDVQQPSLPSAVVVPSISKTSNKSTSKIFSLKKLKAKRDSSPTEPTLPKSLSQLSSEGLSETFIRDNIAPKLESEHLEQTSRKTCTSGSVSPLVTQKNLKSSKAKTLTHSLKSLIKRDIKSIDANVEEGFCSSKASKLPIDSECSSDHGNKLDLVKTSQSLRDELSKKDLKSNIESAKKQTEKVISSKTAESSSAKNSNPVKLNKASPEANETINNKFRKHKSKRVLVSDSSADESPSDTMLVIEETTLAVSAESNVTEPLSKKTVISKVKQSPNSTTSQNKDFSSTNYPSSKKDCRDFVSIDRQSNIPVSILSKHDDLITTIASEFTSHDSPKIPAKQSNSLPKFVKRLPTPNLNAPPHPMKALYDVLKPSDNKKTSHVNTTVHEARTRNPNKMSVSSEDKLNHLKRSDGNILTSCSNNSEISLKTLEKISLDICTPTFKSDICDSPSSGGKEDLTALSSEDTKTTSLNSDLVQDSLHSDDDLHSKKKRGWRPSPLRPNSQPRRPTFSLKKLRRE